MSKELSKVAYHELTIYNPKGSFCFCSLFSLKLEAYMIFKVQWIYKVFWQQKKKLKKTVETTDLTYSSWLLNIYLHISMECHAFFSFKYIFEFLVGRKDLALFPIVAHDCSLSIPSSS